MTPVPVIHKDEDEIIKELYTSKRPKEPKEEVAEEKEAKSNLTLILIIVAFLAGLALATIAQYYTNSDMRQLNSTITEWKQDQEKASKNNAIIQRAVNDNKQIEQRQIKRVDDVQQIMTQMLTPKSVTIK